MTEKEFMEQVQDAEFIRKTWPELQPGISQGSVERRTAKIVGLVPDINNKEKTAKGKSAKSPRSKISQLRIRYAGVTLEFDTANPLEDAVSLLAIMEDLA